MFVRDDITRRNDDGRGGELARGRVMTMRKQNGGKRRGGWVGGGGGESLELYPDEIQPVLMRYTN